MYLIVPSKIMMSSDNIVKTDNVITVVYKQNIKAYIS